MAHFLLVEDEADNRQQCRTLLRQRGHDVTCAENGSIGLQKLRRQPNDIDVIVVNGSMPVLDGKGFMKNATSLVRDRIPCIYDGARISNVRTQDLLRAYGIIRFLRRPREASEFSRAAEEALELRRAFQAGFAPTREPAGSSLRMDKGRSGRSAGAGSIRYVEDSPLGVVATLGRLLLGRAWPAEGLGTRPQGPAPGMGRPRPEGSALVSLVQQELAAYTLASRDEACRIARVVFAGTMRAFDTIGGIASGPVGAFVGSFENGISIGCRPATVVRVDAEGLLHSEAGPALAYPDGFAIHAWHGMHVDPWVVAEGIDYTVDDIRAHPHAELRRRLRSRYGERRYLTETGARIIDVDTVPVDSAAPGGQHITRGLLEDEENRRWLVASDGSTKRVYHMEVPPICRTCREAYEALSGRPGYRTIMEA